MRDHINERFARLDRAFADGPLTDYEAFNARGCVIQAGLRFQTQVEAIAVGASCLWERQFWCVPDRELDPLNRLKKAMNAMTAYARQNKSLRGVKCNEVLAEIELEVSNRSPQMRNRLAKC